MRCVSSNATHLTSNTARWPLMSMRLSRTMSGEFKRVRYEFAVDALSRAQRRALHGRFLSTIQTKMASRR